MIKLHQASIDWLRSGGLGSSTMGARTIVISTGDVILMESGVPALFACADQDPPAGTEVRCESTPAIVGLFVRSVLIESKPGRAPLHYWVLNEVRRPDDICPNCGGSDPTLGRDDFCTCEHEERQAMQPGREP